MSVPANCNVKSPSATNAKHDIIKNVYYPYHRPNSNFIRQQHEDYNIVTPQSSSDESLRFYTSHSELQHILQRRELHGYRYQFTLHSVESRSNVVHSVLWDYETGHVRISPMFKSSEYEYLRRKNTPRRWVDRNGLYDCYASTTGGRIEAQGFWLPYIVARALCSKFCWSIRYALTPIFGNNFPRLCDIERQTLHEVGIEYGTELSLNIDKDIVDTVNARQAILEWCLILTGRDKKPLRKIRLPPLESCWSTYISLASKNPILPPLKDPRKLVTYDANHDVEHDQQVDKQQGLTRDSKTVCKIEYTDSRTTPKDVLSDMQQTYSANVGSYSKAQSTSMNSELYRLFDCPDVRRNDMNAARSLMQLRYGISWGRTP